MLCFKSKCILDYGKEATLKVWFVDCPAIFADLQNIRFLDLQICEVCSKCINFRLEIGEWEQKGSPTSKLKDTLT